MGLDEAGIHRVTYSGFDLKVDRLLPVFVKTAS